MNRAKKFIIFTFLLAFALQVSAQDKTPKIVWKNLKEKYDSFYDIKPTILNTSETPIYFDCDPPDLLNLDSDFQLLQFDEKTSQYFWNVMICGTISKEERKARKKEIKNTEKLKKQGKYVPSGCKLNPNEEYTFNFNKDQWNYLLWGDSSYGTYKSGKFIFKILYELPDEYGRSESPEFLVTPTEEAK